MKTPVAGPATLEDGAAPSPPAAPFETATPAAPESRLRSFFVLWSGQALSLLGSESAQFALIWWLTLETGSAAVLATAAAVGLLPGVVLGPVIGALVDRWRRKSVLLVADGTVAAASAVLAALFFLDAAAPWQVLVLLFVRGLAGAFHEPAALATTSLMVPPAHLARVQGLNQALQGALLLASGPMGALWVASFSMGTVMLIDVATAAFALAPLAVIRIPEPPKDRPSAPSIASGLLREVAAGFRFLASQHGHLALLLLAAIVNLTLTPAFSLLPLLVAQAGGGAATLGFATSAFGAGTLAGGLLLATWGGFRRKVLTIAAGFTGLGVSSAVLALVPAEAVAAVVSAMTVCGLSAPLVSAPILALLQATVPTDLQGRVFTLYGSVAAATAPLGLFLAAPVAELAGVRFWYVVGSLSCIVVAGAVLLPSPLRRLEDAATAPSDLLPAP
jgi:DHA3 family macrolide efflux protein-like MFS transporter